MDPEPPAQTSVASPPSDPHQISSDPEPDADDWDEDRAATGDGRDAGGESLALDEVDWDEINNEVEAAMNESDDDGEEDGDQSERSDRSGMKSGNASEDEGSWTDESNSVIRFVEMYPELQIVLAYSRYSSTTSSPRMKRKRLRSVTPSEIGLNGNVDSDVLRSRLAKRKKVAAERSGTSKLKEGITADELVQGVSSAAENADVGSSPANLVDEEDDDETDDDGEGDAVMDDDEDFLARELEEEWG